MTLTDDEKAAVRRALTGSKSKLVHFVHYLLYILPGLFIGLYGWYLGEIIAVLVGFGVLLGTVVYLLFWSSGFSHHLINALEKYESEVGALENSDGSRT
ncbi:MAG: hypothetical protein CME59_03255 [Halioglobus sp.]|nr:hypothetical protein [Halioglobus sp.]|tara:strand:- start:541 stop:837 length:297 start_codon:yes stop_codon:yes gene_type:complete